jgi:hypothetical protein
MLRKKFGPVFKELWSFLLKNLLVSSKKYGFEIRDPEKTYPGSGPKGQKGTGSQIRIPNTAKNCMVAQFIKENLLIWKYFHNKKSFAWKILCSGKETRGYLQDYLRFLFISLLWNNGFFSSKKHEDRPAKSISKQLTVSATFIQNSP